MYSSLSVFFKEIGHIVDPTNISNYHLTKVCGPYVVTLLIGHIDLDGMWQGLWSRMDIIKTCVKVRLEHVFKCCKPL